MSDRDYNDLLNENYIVYSFRNYSIFIYDKKERRLHIGRNAHMCAPIPEDMTLMSEFLANIRLYHDGILESVSNVVVN